MTLAELQERFKTISKLIQSLTNEQQQLVVAINNEQEKLNGQIKLKL